MRYLNSTEARGAVKAYSAALALMVFAGLGACKPLVHADPPHQPRAAASQQVNLGRRASSWATDATHRPHDGASVYLANGSWREELAEHGTEQDGPTGTDRLTRPRGMATRPAHRLQHTPEA